MIRSVVILCTVLLTFSSYANASAKAAPPVIITGDAVGELRVGSSIEDIKKNFKILKDTIELDGEAIPVRVMEILISNNLVRVEIDKEKIYRIVVITPGLYTQDGIGVGTPLIKLLSFPDLDGDLGEGVLYVFTKKKCGLSFQLSYALSDEDLWKGEGWGYEWLSNLPPDVSVTSVLVVGCGPD